LATSTLEEKEFMDIQSMYFDRSYDRNICQSSAEDLLTVVLGAKCRDGIVLIADKWLTNVIGGKDDERIKIIGDLRHILMGYSGAVNMFDIFRKYVVGDVIITRDNTKRYQYNDVITTSTELIRRFNTSMGKQISAFELLVVKHIQDNSELYHIDVDGNSQPLNYKSIGIGRHIADKFCTPLSLDTIRMNDFIKYAYLSIAYMEECCPGIGVGLGEDGIPTVKYMYRNKDDDEEAPPKDIEECKKFVKNKLRSVKENFDAVVKN